MKSSPFFLDSADGRLFAVHHRPEGACRGQVLLAPPFNEEMNRCRSMVTLQAAALAEQGWGSLVLDLYGTGDSAGDFGDARWSIWQRNLQAGRAWLDHQAGGCRWLWGIRLGAILAAQSCAESPGPGLVLWQPVADGKTHLTQFLRVRMAAALDRADAPKETPATLRALLAAGQPVEVAGYLLHPELTQALDGVRLDGVNLAAGTRTLWLEQAMEGETSLSPMSRQLLERWPGTGAALESRLFQGPAFWHVHERSVALDAIKQTCAWLMEQAHA